MKKLSLKYSVLLAVVSGIFTSVVFPTRFGHLMFPNLGFLAWISFVPLFVAIYRSSARRTFLLAFITGFTYYAISLYWLYSALTQYGKLDPSVSVAVLVLMWLILGVYLAVAPAWARYFQEKWGGPSVLLIPVAWVAVEIARNYFPVGGFPWNNIAYSQYAYSVIIQGADIAGIYGLTFLIIFANALFAEIIVNFKAPGKVHAGVKLIILVVIFSLNLAYGWFRLETVPVHSPVSNKVNIALVQGNIPQEEKWDDGFLEGNLKVYKDYMEWAKNGKAMLTVWPESAFPFVVPLGAAGVKADRLGVDAEAGDGSWLLFGALSIDNSNRKGNLYNSAILVDNKGRIKDRYHKKHLVPFGEYVPFRKLLFFAKKLIAPVGDFLAGKEYRPVDVKGVKVGPLVCYEDVFPEISRAMVVGGANLLVNMTNDAWYGWSSAAHQHLAISVFRAVENRRYMLRATNTGVTAVIDPLGKIELESDLFTRSFVVAKVSLFEGFTIYDRMNDAFAYVCALFVLIATGIVFVKNLKGDIVKNSCEKVNRFLGNLIIRR